jgi:membrane protease YdiL (CAAX protease family)
MKSGWAQRRSWVTYLVLAQLFLFTNGSALLGKQFPSIPSPTLFYLILMAWPFILDSEFLKELKKGTLAEYSIKFFVGGIVMLAAYYGIFVYALGVQPNPIPYSSVWPLFVLQLFFVAPAEEIFFRGFLPRLYNPEGKSWRMYVGTSTTNALILGGFTLADVATSSTFSVFHYTAYGPQALSAFIIAFILSMIWLWVSKIEVGFPFHLNGERRPMGLAMTMGMHFFFNACVLGILVPGGVIFGA